MRISGLVSTAIALVASTVLSGQQQTVFRSEINYVEVDAVVTDRHGDFVPGLTAADFEVREQYKSQPISTFSYVNMPTDPAASTAGVELPRLRSDLHIEASAMSGRIYLLFLSLGDTGETSMFVARQARQFVSDFMLPNDTAAIWNTQYTTGELTFTSDRAALLRVIDGLPARPAYTHETLGPQLRDAIDWFSAIQGRRKSLLLFAAGTKGLTSFSMPFESLLRYGGLQRLDGDWTFTPSGIAGRADVHIYPVDARGLVAPLPPTVRTGDGLQAAEAVSAQYSALFDSLWTMRMLADDTGGRAIINTNDYREGFAKIVDDNSRYYLLGYYSPNKARDGRFMNVSVKSSRPGVTVRARKGYIAR